MPYIHDSYTDSGGRKNNEDAFITSQKDKAFLYVVADGLGGHDSGELASKIAVNEIKHFLTRLPILSTRLAPLSPQTQKLYKSK